MNRSDNSNSSSWKQQSLQDVCIALIVFLLPFISFSHLLFSKELDQISFLGVLIDHGFPDNQVFAWFVLLHLSSIIFTLLILLLSKGTWRYILIAPIYYFLAYSVWMFSDFYPEFPDFLLSAVGMSLLIFVSALILICDMLLKARLTDRNINLTFEAGCREFFDAWNSKCNREIRKTLDRKQHLSLKEYVHRVYFHAVLVEKQEARIINYNGISREKSKGKNCLGAGSVLILLMFILLAHNWIPEGENQFEYLGIQINDFGFIDVKTFIFYSTNKFVLFSFGLIWFLNSTHWWRGAILSPILFYLYQFYESIQPVRSLESAGNLNILPLVGVTILGVILIWELIRRVSINRDYRDVLHGELEKSLTELSREEARSRLRQMQVHNPEIL